MFARYELVREHLRQPQCSRPECVEGRELGRGGQAVVYEARDAELGRPVALKVLQQGKRSLTSVRRFQREARAAAGLNHENIVSVYEVGEWQGRHYIAMELVRGGSLEDVIARGRIPVRDGVEIVAKVAGAVQRAHEDGIVHRDIKPANILMDDGGEPRLADFGFALDADARTQITRTGAVMGTPAYMPPEQARGGAHGVDARGDVYSLGAVLYEVLTGRPPFAAETSLMLLQKIVYEPPPNPTEVRHVVPADAATICMKCLEKEPERRYRTAAELADDCRRFLAGEPVAASGASLAYQAKRTLSRNVSLVAVALLALAAVAAVCAWGYRAVGAHRASAARWREEHEKHSAALSAAEAEAGSLRRRIEDVRRETAGIRALVAGTSASGGEAGGDAGVRSSIEEAGRPTPRGASAGRTGKARPDAPAAGALGAARDYEETHRTDIAGAIRRYEAVARDFAATVEAAEARVHLIRLRHDAERVGRLALAKELAARKAAAEEERRGREALSRLLSEFDSFVEKRDYTNARRWAERRAREEAKDELADLLLAAARVARLLEERRLVVRRAAETLVGAEAELETVKGRRAGKVEGVTDEGIRLSTEIVERGRVLGRRGETLEWSELAPGLVDELADKWKAEGVDGAVARAYLALGRGDSDLAVKQLESAGDHPLLLHVFDAIDAPRRKAAGAAEAAARAAPEEETPEEPIPRVVMIACPACKGDGVIKTIGCPTCAADGYTGNGRCTDCNGTGRTEYQCYACQGSGSISSRGDPVQCPVCRGRGRPACTGCTDTGEIARPNPQAAGGPTTACTPCGGTGLERDVRCSRCRGTGWLSLSDSGGRFATPCRFCGGDGRGPPVCGKCNGRGYVGPRGLTRVVTPCTACCGTGHSFLHCKHCRGCGWIRTQ